jgi:hypothetical protein
LERGFSAVRVEAPAVGTSLADPAIVWRAASARADADQARRIRGRAFFGHGASDMCQINPGRSLPA